MKLHKKAKILPRCTECKRTVQSFRTEWDPDNYAPDRVEANRTALMMCAICLDKKFAEPIEDKLLRFRSYDQASIKNSWAFNEIKKIEKIIGIKTPRRKAKDKGNTRGK